MSKWIEFVKDWAKKHNMNYAKALKDPKMKEAYKSPKMEGGATKEQRANAVMLRTRINDTDAKEELNNIAHSADPPKELAKWEKKLGRKNKYQDYTNSPDVGSPSPTDIIDVAFEMYFDDLDTRPVEDLINNPDIFPADGFFIPAKYISRWQRIVDKVQNYKPPKTEDEEKADDAFWTHPDDPRTIEFLDLLQQYKKEKDKDAKYALWKVLADNYEKNFQDEVRAYNKKWGAVNGFSPLTSRDKGAILFPIKPNPTNPKSWIGGRGLY